MRRGLGPDQRRRVEDLARGKGVGCGLCGGSDLRCGGDAASYIGGGYSVQLWCTNTRAEAHAGGIGLVQDHSLTSDEARRVGLK